MCCMRHKEWVPPWVELGVDSSVTPQGALHTGRQVTPLAVDELSFCRMDDKGASASEVAVHELCCVILSVCGYY